MIKAKHHPIIFNLFKLYTLYLLKKNFHQIQYDGTITKSNKAFLVIANHISWWDGFWLLHFNNTVLKKNFYFMMLETQLRKYWYFQYCGGFSIHKKSKSIIKTLNYCNQLLQKPNNMVLIFPQGELCSLYNQHFHFERGIEYLLKNSEPNIQVIMVVNLIEYYAYRKPSLYTYYKDLSITDLTVQDINTYYNTFFKQTLEKHIKKAER